MPQTTDELRKLMKEWFGDEIDDVGPSQFLFSRGYSEKAGVWYPPVPAHNATPDEFACLRFLAEEWDYDFHLINPYPEAKFRKDYRPSPSERPAT